MTTASTRLGANGRVFLTWLVLFGLVPFALIFTISFGQKGPNGELLFSPTLMNFARSFDLIYGRVVLKTLTLAGSATVLCLLIGFPVAYYLARAQGRLRTVGLFLLFIPFWTNFILRIYGIVSVVGSGGLLNHWLLSMGIIQEPLEILYTRTGVYLGLVYNYLPFLVVPVFSAVEKLDPALREAAQDLGATRWKTFTKVVLPNVREGTFVGVLFVFVPMLGEYVIPDLLGGAKESFLGNVMVSQFFVVQDWPFGSALASLMAVLMLGALIVQMRWTRKTDVSTA